MYIVKIPAKRRLNSEDWGSGADNCVFPHRHALPKTFLIFNLRRYRKLKVNPPYEQQLQDIQKNMTI